MFVTIGTNSETISPLAPVNRRNRDLKQNMGISKPTVLKTSNSQMGGVDHHDSLVRTYTISVRGKSGAGHCLDG